MPLMWDSLACLDIRAVRFAHSKCQAYSGLRDAGESRQNLFYVDFAGEPWGKVRRFPMLYGMFVQPLRNRTLGKGHRTFRDLAAFVKVVSRNLGSAL
jgi:hypothetical protein